MWEFYCGICNVPCQSSDLLERHNISIKHKEELRSWDMFPPVDAYEFTVLHLSRPSGDIPQRGDYSLPSEATLHTGMFLQSGTVFVLEGNGLVCCRMVHGACMLGD